MSFTNVLCTVYNAQYQLKSICFCKQEDLISIDTGNRIFFYKNVVFPFYLFFLNRHILVCFSPKFFLNILQELGRPCHSITSFSRKFPFRFFLRFVRLLSQFVCVCVCGKRDCLQLGDVGNNQSLQNGSQHKTFLVNFILVRYTHFIYCVL